MSAAPTMTSKHNEITNAGIVSEVVCQDDEWPRTVFQSDFHARIDAAIGRFLEFDGKETIVVAFSNDAAVKVLNAQFRGQDKPTNVLSFPTTAPAGIVESSPHAAATFLGDIILARETVAREASEQDIAIEHHTTHLIIHGILHLLGYDHQDERSAKEMEALEICILADLGIENPYTEELDHAR